MEHYFSVAEEEGIKKDEMGAVEACVMAVASGRVQSQVMDVIQKKTSASINQTKKET